MQITAHCLLSWEFFLHLKIKIVQRLLRNIVYGYYCKRAFVVKLPFVKSTAIVIVSFKQLLSPRGGLSDSDLGELFSLHLSLS